MYFDTTPEYIANYMAYINVDELKEAEEKSKKDLINKEILKDIYYLDNYKYVNQNIEKLDQYIDQESLDKFDNDVYQGVARFIISQYLKNDDLNENFFPLFDLYPADNKATYGNISALLSPKVDNPLQNIREHIKIDQQIVPDAFMYRSDFSKMINALFSLEPEIDIFEELNKFDIIKDPKLWAKDESFLLVEAGEFLLKLVDFYERNQVKLKKASFYY